MNTPQDKKRRPPPPVLSDDPEAALEEQLQENPENENIQVDVGSDESMDASDPVSASRPAQREPVPSSGYDEKDGQDSDSNS